MSCPLACRVRSLRALPVLSYSPFPDFEASFLRLLDKITNGTLIEINETGVLAPHAFRWPLF